MIMLNESKIKYEKLDELLQDQLHDLRFSSNVNILVDLKEIYKKFFRPGILDKFDSVQIVKEEILSDIINTIGHYRTISIREINTQISSSSTALKNAMKF